MTPADDDDDSQRKIRFEYPYDVQKYSSVTIDIDQQIRLAATIWMPKNKNKELKDEEETFASILEYLPYRKADWTSNRDEKRLKYLSAFGYVSIRVDIRGTGNLQGLFTDEYTFEEQSDGLKILQWIENQHWSNGKIVIYGKSWGGFNGLQIASLQPKSLYGIISAYSTDDRYSDDIHYIGGCLAAQEALSWSSQMLIWLAIPPHPQYQGGIDKDQDTIQIWKQRLNNLIPLDYYWIKHQRRDDYWRHGSICEDYSKILCPVLLIGGFADLYTDAVLRLINKFECPKRAIIGPWGHQWPDEGYPGPQIGYLNEIIQWLDYHIKGIRNNYENKSIFSIYQFHPNVNELNSIVQKRSGKWIQSNQIPLYPSKHIQRNHCNNEQICQEEEEKEMKYYLSFGSLRDSPHLNENSPTKISFLSPQETGIASGSLFHLGDILNPDNPIDQREDDGRSVIFDSIPLNYPLELFGFPKVKLNLSSSTGIGLICVRLSMIDKDSSSSILLSRGILNLTHYKSHEYPQLLNVDQIYNIEIDLSCLCVSIPSGSRLRLALSTSYWPMVWPSTNLSTLTSCENEFDIPEYWKGIDLKVLRRSSINRLRTFDEVKQMIELKIADDNGSIEYPDGLIFDEKSESIYKIRRNDPQSASVHIKRFVNYSFQNSSSTNVQIQTNSIMLTEQSPSMYNVQHQLTILNNHQSFFSIKNGF